MEGELARNGHLVEPLARLYPSDVGLELLLVGPEMGDWEIERPNPHGATPSLLVRSLSGTLHMVEEGRMSAGPRPNFVVLCLFRWLAL